MDIRAAVPTDADSIWALLEPTIRAAETYTLPADMNREDALASWFSPGHEVFVAEQSGAVRGSYFLRPNQRGGGSHVANCGYVTAAAASGGRVARRIRAHSLDYAESRGF